MKPGDIASCWRIGPSLRKLGYSGEVFLASHVDDPKRVVVIKHYVTGCKATPEEFTREMDLVESQPIPGVMPKYLGRGKFEGTDYYVMSRAERLPDKLPHALLVALMKRLIKACRMLNAKGLYHCDIKPDNIGLVDGMAILLDFGCVLTAEELPKRQKAPGTKPYQAPEVLLGLVSELSEIYSLAATACKFSEKLSKFRLALATIPALSASSARRPPSYDAFSDLLDLSGKDFLTIVRGYARLWKNIIYCGLALLAIFGCTILYINEQIFKHRRNAIENEKGHLIKANAFNKALHQKITSDEPTIIHLDTDPESR